MSIFDELINGVVEHADERQWTKLAFIGAEGEMGYVNLSHASENVYDFEMYISIAEAAEFFAIYEGNSLEDVNTAKPRAFDLVHDGESELKPEVVVSVILTHGKDYGSVHL